jgi:hypothetical protein
VEERSRLEKFAALLAESVFREGAILLHGAHPSLTPVILAAAQRHFERTRRRPSLQLLVSEYFRSSKGTFDDLGSPLEVADLEPIAAGGDREQSPFRLRDALAAKADVLVAIGGKWWAKDTAGVPAEFGLAIERGIPSFLLGGLGGAVAGYLAERDDILRDVRNGLDKAANIELAKVAAPELLAEKVLRQIGLLPLGRRETLSGEPFRILCLDGGGVRGAFTAAVLAAAGAARCSRRRRGRSRRRRQAHFTACREARRSFINIINCMGSAGDASSP